jgi:hypothetical protein
MGMTGLYFHMDSRIKVLNGIQRDSLELFKSYVLTNGRQQGEINSLNNKIEELQYQVEEVNDTLDEKLTELYRLLLSKEANAADSTGFAEEYFFPDYEEERL